MKRFIAVAAFIATLSTGIAFGQGADKPTSGTAEKIEAKEVGNKHCPVMTKKLINEKSQSVTYKGHIVKLCCKSCVKNFANKPDEYLKVAQEDAKK